ncbi:MAG: acyl-CoA dehydrogenase family protein, partial [Pseudomonas sp.]|nr:acyl-CoA dehydrogenase family protein [Pseudomonas sp.]
MDFAYSPKVQALRERVTAFMDAHVYPAEAIFDQQVAEGDRWQPTAIMEELKLKARAEGLWNLFLPESELGAGLTNLEYAPLAEIMGRSMLGSEPFNCSAPDTGNMEVLVRYASEAQKNQWLEPLLRGDIRSAFAMTEPDVASSDATNMTACAVRDGDEWLINGRKWWTSGA